MHKFSFGSWAMHKELTSNQEVFATVHLQLYLMTDGLINTPGCVTFTNDRIGQTVGFDKHAPASTVCTCKLSISQFRFKKDQVK